MIKTCPHCEIEKEYKNHQQFGAHVSRCKKNPNLQETLKTIQVRNAAKIIDRILLESKCKCGAEFSQLVTQSDINRGNYKAFCSRKCANSRIRTNEIKDKIRESVKKTYSNKPKLPVITKDGTQRYPNSRVYHFVCTNTACRRVFTSKYDPRGGDKEINYRYCSRKCRCACLDYKKKLSDNIRERYDKNPEMHPNRRCSKIKETYPEKYLREYLENNNIVFEKQFRIKRYFVDFYIPKLNLCLEVDGERWHDRTSEREIKRENIIKEKHNLIRFWSKPLVKGEYQEDIQAIIRQYNKLP